MSEFATVARPYAKATFDFAIENGTIDQWTEMLAFASQVVKNTQVQEFLTGSLPATKISDLIISICGDQLDQYGQNLIRLMAENKRLAALPDVLLQFLSYVDEHQLVATVQVISAKTLTKAQEKKIKTAMEKRLARKVKLNCSVDSSLIAGAIIRTEDFVIDGSSRGQLTQLANNLQ